MAGGPKEKAGLAGAADSVVASFPKRPEPVFCFGTSPNKDGVLADVVACDAGAVGAADVLDELEAGGAKEKVGLGGSLLDVVVFSAAGAGVDSAGFEGAPKLNPPDAGLEPKSPPEGAEDVAAGSVGAAGLPKLNEAGFAASSAGFAPKSPAPPVLAPNVELDGGGPAGVVDGLEKLKALLVPLAAGVPKSEGADDEGAAVLSGVPNENVGFEESVP